MLNPESLPQVDSFDSLRDFAADNLDGEVALRVAYDEALRDGAAKTVARIPELERVAALEIVNSLDPKALKALLESPFLTRVRALSLASNYIHDTGTKALASWEPLSAVTHLQLSGIGLAGSGFKALLASEYLGALSHLDVKHNNLKAGQVKALANDALATRLTSWSLDYNEIGDGGVKAIASSPLMRSSNAVRLDGVSMKKNGLKALLASEDIGALRELSIAGNHGLGDAGLALLGKATQLAGLRKLELVGTGLGDATADLLAGAAHFSGLEELRVDTGGGLTDAGMERLLSSPHVGDAVRRGNEAFAAERADR